MGKPFSKERLLKIQRLRKARRLWAKEPLFAFFIMQELYKDYTYAEFMDDLRLRKPRKKKQGKSQRIKYGRYNRMNQLYTEYELTGNLNYAIEAEKLFRRLRKPYLLRVRINGIRIEYTFNACIPLKAIENLNQEIQNCASEAEVDAKVKVFRQNQSIL